jgi:ABC-type branched-subunit amino acid transport system substrate-binding protein
VVPVAEVDGRFYRLARWVQGRPVWVAGGVAIVLVLLAAPFLSARFENGVAGIAPPAPVPAVSGSAKAALLVPLSGANAELGQAILDAAQLALFETPGDGLILVPRDTAGTVDGAAKAARAAIDDGAKLILGPLLAAEVEAVKPIARDAHLNVIAFSTVTEFAGGNTFLMGFLPRQEVVREVAHARERGLTRFAALAPNSPYGRLMADALRDLASASGATVVRVEFYDPRTGDTAPAVQRLFPEAGASAAGGPAAVGTPGFDALLVPEGSARLKQIARQIREASPGGKPLQLLGSGLWDVPDLGSEPALVGGWFAASPPEPRHTFAQRFQATYGRAPPRLASLGYDAAALAAVLAHSEGEPFSQQAILRPNGFTGVDGLFRFTPGGLVQRGLVVLEVEPEGDVVVSPAPRNFQDLAY